MVTFTSRDASDTRRIGREAVHKAGPGWVFGLSGDLGAGKTQFVKGVAEALGITARIQSPTFALVNEHLGTAGALFHLDLYRLESTAQILAAGLEEYFDPKDGISAIEWFERWEGPPPPRLCRVILRHADEHTRLITLRYDPPRA